MNQLWWTIRSADTDLAGVIAEVAVVLGAGAIGFLSSPAEHLAVRLDGSTPSTPDGPVDLSGVFAARLFTPLAELRWVQVGGGLGEAVVVGEQAAPLPGWVAKQADVVDALDGRYALWGRRFDPHPSDVDGWCRALEGRLGWVDLPLRGRPPERGRTDHSWPDEYLSLIYREYVGLDTHGNAVVVDERLIAIEVAAATVGKVTP